MILTLLRHTWGAERTLGTLLGKGLEPLAWTLEDANRLAFGFPKLPGSTAIPAGLYRVRTTWSNRFSRLLPLVDDVPGFTGVRIHAGNTEQDTEGCVLVGWTLNLKSLAAGSSRPALAAVQMAVKAAERTPEGVWLSVVDLKPQPETEKVLRASWGQIA